MANIPKEDDNEVRRSIIRTTIKNENLLNKKMENSKVKKYNRKKTSALRHRLDRSVKTDGVLSHKIEQSIQRAKFVQSARKANWDKINKSIEVKANDKPEKTQQQIEQEEEDAYVDEMFDRKAEPEPKVANRFALLDEEEA